MNVSAPEQHATTISPQRLAESYRHCEQVARKQAKNFYFSFVTLPPDRRAAMCAVYAFMRYSDDVSDEAAEDSSKARQMLEWRHALDRAFAGDYGDSLILPAFHDTVRRYDIPTHYFYALIDGCEMDLTRIRYETFDELHDYCYHVASVVGFVCIHIWGFDRNDPDVMKYANACGQALQLTNILRDVHEDAQRNRIYLPAADMRQFGVSEGTLIRGILDTRFRALMRFEAQRARSYYDQVNELFPRIHPRGRPTLYIMVRIYRGILDVIERSNYDVFTRRARVPTAKKLTILGVAMIRGLLSCGSRPSWERSRTGSAK